MTCSPDNIIQTFNAYGASEACDMLAVDAMIHPAMPAHLVCGDLVWPWFRNAVIQYRCCTHQFFLKGTLPLVSSCQPIYFNADGHRRFLASVKCSHRLFFQASPEYLQKCHSLGYLQLDNIIQDTGIAICE